MELFETHDRSDVVSRRIVHADVDNVLQIASIETASFGLHIDNYTLDDAM